MLRFSKSKIIFTVGIIVIGLLLAVPSMMSREQRESFQRALPGWVPSWIIPVPRHRARPRLAGRLARAARGRRQRPHAHPDDPAPRRRSARPARNPRDAAGRNPAHASRRADPRSRCRRSRQGPAEAARTVAALRKRRSRPGRRPRHRRVGHAGRADHARPIRKVA